jgi:hypothetical protein
MRPQNESRRPVNANVADTSRNHPPQSQRPWAAEHVLQNRLAAIDRMRDHALASENLDLLQHADELEQMAREQHSRMTGILPPAPVALPGFTPLPPSTTTAGAPTTSTTTDPAPLPPTYTGVAPAIAPPPGPYVPPGLHGREFGQHVAEQARLYGHEWGQYVSEQAQQGGTPFGRGIDRRNFEPPIVTAPPTVTEPRLITEPPIFPEPGTTVQP